MQDAFINVVIELLGHFVIGVIRVISSLGYFVIRVISSFGSLRPYYEFWSAKLSNERPVQRGDFRDWAFATFASLQNFAPDFLAPILSMTPMTPMT